MGTTRKLAIKAYRSTQPELKSKREFSSVQAPGQFFGMTVATVAFAASYIKGASADYSTDRDPKEDRNAFIVFGCVTVGLIAVVTFSALTQKLITRFNKLPVSNRIAPLPQVELELYEQATNPKTPLALTGVKEAFI